MSAQTAVLNELLEPVGRCLTPEAAQQLVELRASPSAQARIEELATKSTEGTLTKDEEVEYETYVSVGNFIAILQAKARKMLKNNSTT
jgi:hypothetical protein